MWECWNLQDVPDTLAGLTSLEKMDLSYSSIASLPPSIGKLSTLKDLLLCGCKKLTSLPDTLAGLTSLEKMDLSKSSIASLPPSIGQLSSLKELSLAHCKHLTSLPETIVGLKSLIKLVLSDSTICTLPDGVFRLNNATVVCDDCPFMKSDELLARVLAQPDGPMKRQLFKMVFTGPINMDHLVRIGAFPRKRPQDECCVCYEPMEEENYLFWECTHTNVCRECASKIIFPSSGPCPCCNAKSIL